jgi:hypothetical protein
MSIDTEIFDRAETQRVELEQRLQLTSDELTCVLLLILAKNARVQIPAVFNRLVTNYAIFLNPEDSRDTTVNQEKHSIRFYCGQMGIDTTTLNASLSNLIARKLGITVDSIVPNDTLPELQPPKDGW